eukprot:TRINITY_DN12025_c0_g3_i1.p1 TRINITY_DN12025_c0_g3~~TRINITY_DN12025_c0_g3_i1.p1  ORF type:complete len:1560 (-),score=274.05 TRINITY_DN12025_c0_g3_i1:1025-5704(-)
METDRRWSLDVIFGYADVVHQYRKLQGQKSSLPSSDIKQRQRAVQTRKSLIKEMNELRPRVMCAVLHRSLCDPPGSAGCDISVEDALKFLQVTDQSLDDGTIDKMSVILPSSDVPSRLKLSCARLLHATSVGWLCPREKMHAALLVFVGTTLMVASLLDPALDALLQALRILKSCPGENHDLVAGCLLAIGTNLRLQNRLPEALEHCEQTLSIYRRIYGTDNHIDVARSLRQVAQLRRQLRQYDLALKLFTEALAAFRTCLDAERTDIAEALTSIGCVHRECGNYDEALAFLQKAMDIWDCLDVADSAHIAAECLTCMGDVFRSLGQYGQALRCFKRVLAIGERIGSDNVVQTLLNIATILRVQGAHVQAGDYCHRALATCVKLHGADSMLAATTYHSISVAHLCTGRYDDALTCQNRALEILQRLPGAHEERVALVLNASALVLRQQRKFSAALQHHQRSLKSATDALGDANEKILGYQSAMAHSLLLCGDQQQAAEIYLAGKLRRSTASVCCGALLQRHLLGDDGQRCAARVRETFEIHYQALIDRSAQFTELDYAPHLQLVTSYAELMCALGDPGSAIKEYQRSAAVFRNSKHMPHLMLECLQRAFELSAVWLPPQGYAVCWCEYAEALLQLNLITRCVPLVTDCRDVMHPSLESATSERVQQLQRCIQSGIDSLIDPVTASAQHMRMLAARLRGELHAEELAGARSTVGVLLVGIRSTLDQYYGSLVRCVCGKLPKPRDAADAKPADVYFPVHGSEEAALNDLRETLGLVHVSGANQYSSAKIEYRLLRDWGVKFFKEQLKLAGYVTPELVVGRLNDNCASLDVPDERVKLLLRDVLATAMAQPSEKQTGVIMGGLNQLCRALSLEEVLAVCKLDKATDATDLSSLLASTSAEAVPYGSVAPQELMGVCRLRQILLEIDCRASIKAIVEEQSSHYMANKHQEAWLEKASAINNDIKHFRLTPQQTRATNEEDVGLMKRANTIVAIQYLEPLLYPWVFIPDFRELPHDEAYALSRELLQLLKDAEWVNKQQVKHDSLDLVVQAVCQSLGDDDEARNAQLSALLKSVESNLCSDAILATWLSAHPEVTAEMVTRVCATLLRHRLQHSRIHLEPDTWVDVQQLIDHSIDRMEHVSRVLQGDVQRISGTALPVDDYAAAPVAVVTVHPVLVEYIDVCAKQRCVFDAGVTVLHAKLDQCIGDMLSFAQRNDVLADYPWLVLDCYARVRSLFAMSPLDIMRMHRVDALLAYAALLEQHVRNDSARRAYTEAWYLTARTDLRDKVLQLEDSTGVLDKDTEVQFEYVCGELCDLQVACSVMMTEAPLHRCAVQGAVLHAQDIVVKLRHLLDQCWKRMVTRRRRAGKPFTSVDKDNFPRDRAELQRLKVAWETDMPDLYAVVEKCTESSVWHDLVRVCNAKHEGLHLPTAANLAARMPTATSTAREVLEWFYVGVDSVDIIPVVALLCDALPLVRATAIALAEAESTLPPLPKLPQVVAEYIDSGTVPVHRVRPSGDSLLDACSTVNLEQEIDKHLAAIVLSPHRIVTSGMGMPKNLMVPSCAE